MSFIWLLPWTALARAVSAKLLASLASTAFCLVWEAISLIEAVSCSMELACSVGPLGKGLAAVGDLAGAGGHLIGGGVEIGQDLIKAADDQVQGFF